MFENIFNFADLRKAYHAASRKAHPDMGGSTAAMQEVNAAYEKAVKRIERTGERFETPEQEQENAAEWKHQTTAADMAEYAEILQKLFGLDGIEIELCGSWLWISGNTRQYKDILKEWGCKWSNNKKAWYWYAGEYHRHGKRIPAAKMIESCNACYADILQEVSEIECNLDRMPEIIEQLSSLHFMQERIMNSVPRHLRYAFHLSDVCKYGR